MFTLSNGREVERFGLYAGLDVQFGGGGSRGRPVWVPRFYDQHYVSEMEQQASTSVEGFGHLRSHLAPYSVEDAQDYDRDVLGLLRPAQPSSEGDGVFPDLDEAVRREFQRQSARDSEAIRLDQPVPPLSIALPSLLQQRLHSDLYIVTKQLTDALDSAELLSRGATADLNAMRTWADEYRRRSLDFERQLLEAKNTIRLLEMDANVQDSRLVRMEGSMKSAEAEVERLTQALTDATTAELERLSAENETIRLELERERAEKGLMESRERKAIIARDESYAKLNMESDRARSAMADAEEARSKRQLADQAMVELGRRYEGLKQWEVVKERLEAELAQARSTNEALRAENEQLSAAQITAISDAIANLPHDEQVQQNGESKPVCTMLRKLTSDVPLGGDALDAPLTLPPADSQLPSGAAEHLLHLASAASVATEDQAEGDESLQDEETLEARFRARAMEVKLEKGLQPQM
jgi:hypothetical protein